MTTTTGLHPRVELLLALVRTQSGEWTTRRVDRAYAQHSYDAPQHHTHRHDLDLLHRMGVLDRHDQPGRRYYTLREPS